MKILAAILLVFGAAAGAACAPVEVWLTAERRAALGDIARRPAVVRQQRLDNQTVVFHWTNSAVAVTTQRVERILGKKAASAWQSRLDAKDKEKQALIDDLKAVANKPTKQSLEAIITKHSKKEKE